MSAPAQAQPPAPSILRRLASMLYEAVLLAAVAFFAASLFLLASQGRPPSGGLRFALQAYLLAVFAAYFLWCWLRGGQTLPMKAWRIRLVAPGHARVPARLALLRFAYAALFMGALLASVAAAFEHRNVLLAFASLALSGIGIGWALVDRDRQFLHDRLAGTRLIQVD
ncbi:MAG: RDD family protein [Burkholderiales bacterium]|nr:RDD family protein [Burkholderiales bacterium]